MPQAAGRRARRQVTLFVLAILVPLLWVAGALLWAATDRSIAGAGADVPTAPGRSQRGGHGVRIPHIG